jgi:phage-related tail protein
MAPSPSLLPSMADAKGSWDVLETAMDWFSKIVDTFYGYSDGLIKHRQKLVDTKDKLSKAEKEAFRIMQEKGKKQETVEKVLGKRGGEWEADWESLWD